MIRRRIYIGGWKVYFIFAPDGYDEEEILDLLYDLDAPDEILVQAARKMRDERPNEGFTYSNPSQRQSVVVMGPAVSSNERLNTIIHEIFHNTVEVASEMGANLRGEVPAYIAGDTADVLAGVICQLGCDRC